MLFRRQLIRAIGTIALDGMLLLVAFIAACWLRDDALFNRLTSRILLAWLPFVLCLQVCLLTMFDVPRSSWRYVGLKDAERIALALGIAGLTLMILQWADANLQGTVWLLPESPIPVGLIVLDLVLSLFLLIGIRVGTRWRYERQDQQSPHMPERSFVIETPTLLIGAGHAGVLVARQLASRPDIHSKIVGFLDDDPRKLGMFVCGIPVLGGTDRIPELVRSQGVTQAFITIANVAGPKIRRITDSCKRCGIVPKIIPGVMEIIDGRVTLSHIRDVAIEDLLRREPVQLDAKAIADCIHRRRVLVTGAGGSIGSELCQIVCEYTPQTLILVERAENNLFQIHRTLTQAHPHITIIPCLVDICDDLTMRAIFADHCPEVVFHAAAHKHVPLMEDNPIEAVKNNILGTEALADLSNEFHVAEFVMISTDKAVNPTSVMGVSKRITELYVQALSQRSRTRFITVRFGNVLGSSGSVIPIFKEQIAHGGPVTVTHPDMKRYFMTIPEACQLVLQAASMGHGGEIFILDMGEPVGIMDLAGDLIRLSGFLPGEIEIRITGIRPGEKLLEELMFADECAEKTKHPRIYIGKHTPANWQQLAKQLDELRSLAEKSQPDRIRMKFKEIVPEYQWSAHVRQKRENKGKTAAEAGRELVSVNPCD